MEAAASMDGVYIKKLLIYTAQTDESCGTPSDHADVGKRKSGTDLFQKIKGSNCRQVPFKVFEN